MSYHNLILTAASKSFAGSLYGLIGSLNCNWPTHPRILVYDIGLDAETSKRLKKANIEVKRVPPFCPHWRHHFAWKIWACHDAPCRSYLWLDAGICVLRPMPEIFEMIDILGYFCHKNGLVLSECMTPSLQKNLKLNSSVLRQMLSIGGGIHGIRKTGKGKLLIEDAVKLSLVEENLKATAPRQFHDQTLLSVLFHNYFSPVIFADQDLYACDRGPRLHPQQRIWNHRRAMRKEDISYFFSYLSHPGPSYIPNEPIPQKKASLLKKMRIKVAKMRGRYPEKEPGSYIYNGVRD